jgi:hypothetical protein
MQEASTTLYRTLTHDTDAYSITKTHTKRRYELEVLQQLVLLCQTNCYSIMKEFMKVLKQKYQYCHTLHLPAPLKNADI